MNYLIKTISICTILAISLFAIFGCSVDNPAGVADEVTKLSKNDIDNLIALQNDISATTSSLHEEFDITKPTNNSWHVKNRPVEFRWTQMDHPLYTNETYYFYINGVQNGYYTSNLIYNLYFSNVGTHIVRILCKYGPYLEYGQWSENTRTVNICDPLIVSDVIGPNPFDSNYATRFRVNVSGGQSNSYQWKVFNSIGQQVGNTITTADLWTTQLPYMASGWYTFQVKVRSIAGESITKTRSFTNLH